MDIWNMLRSSKVPNDNLTALADALNGIVEFRHGIIHRYEIDRQLERKRISVILETSIAVIEVFTEHVERLRGFPVRETYEPEPESDEKPPLSQSHKNEGPTPTEAKRRLLELRRLPAEN
jgi:hypothetical protein